MSIMKNVGPLLKEVIGHPTVASYILEKGGKRVVIRAGGNYSGQDLSGLNLKGLDLRGTNFQDSNLDGTNFVGAHLEHANFTGATLKGALLFGAHLYGANINIDNPTGLSFDPTPTGLSDALAETIKLGGSK